ncbi:MAG: ABC transporter substrate-binding protein [Bacteroidota bacterium]
MKKSIAFAAFLFILLQACQTDGLKNNSSQKSNVEYASMFSVDTVYGFTRISIPDAWNKNQDSTKLLLIPKNDRVPDNVADDYLLLRTPLKRLAVMSGTHIAFLDLLNELDKVVGVGDFRLIKNPEIRQRIQAGRIKEIGINNTFKKEQLLEADVDAVLVSPYENQTFKSLTDMGITVIPVPDYLETLPLGRAEWLKFFSLLTGKSKEAGKIFRQTTHKYHSLKGKLENIEDRPTVFSGKPYGGVWYQPGGASYMATLFEDAGADYLWSENSKTGGIPLDFETVYARAANADFWRLVVKSDQDYQLQNLLNEDERYKDFMAFRKRQILVCNVARVPYYEEAPTEPHVVLAD